MTKKTFLQHNFITTFKFIILAIQLYQSYCIQHIISPSTSSWVSTRRHDYNHLNMLNQHRQAFIIFHNHHKRIKQHIPRKNLLSSTSIYLSSSTSSDSSNSSNKIPNQQHKNITIPEINLYHKPKQIRRQLKQPRRPRSFWSDIHNIEAELRKFWIDLNVPIPKNEPPPIPNEALLNHFERNDLRYAIANMGGRDVVSYRLNDAKLIPGKWTLAVKTCKEVQFLLHPSNPAGRGLSKTVPPIAPYVKRSLKKRKLAMMKKQKGKQSKINYEKLTAKQLEKKRMKKSDDIDEVAVVDDETQCHITNQNEMNNNIGTIHDDYDIEEEDDDDDLGLRFMGGQRWAHSSNRNPRGHWNQEVIIQELYDYLLYIKTEKGRPSVWMPRGSELQTAGRNDLKQAMLRFGGSKKTCELANLIPYREWRHFESTLELYVELEKYLAIYHNGEEKTFPKLADMQMNGHERLYDLIMEYGGRKIIATKLDMEFQAQTKLDLFKGMSFGKFSLDFAVRLMYFIRNDLLQKDPPLDIPKLQMPTKQYLLDFGEERLANEILKYGGHENIARRLNLSFDLDEARRENLFLLLSKQKKEIDIRLDN